MDSYKKHKSDKLKSKTFKQQTSLFANPNNAHCFHDMDFENLLSKSILLFKEQLQWLKKCFPQKFKRIESISQIIEKIFVFGVRKTNYDFTPYKTSSTNAHKTSTAKNIQNSNIMHPFDGWISVSKASEITGLNKGVISRLASEGVIFNNGKKGRGRKLLKSTVLLVEQDRNEQEYLKDAKKEEHKINEIKNQIPYRH